jgi:PAS domain S-box-containing protein
VQTLFQSRPSFSLTPIQVRRVLLGLFAVMGGLYFGQAKQALRSASSGDQTVGAISEAMQSRFNGMSLALMSYLQTHDSLSLERIKSDGAQAGVLLGDLKKEASKEGAAQSYALVEKAHDDIRQATMALLQADHAEMKVREALTATGESLMSVMIARMEPSIKPAQLNSSALLQCVLAAAAEAKSLTTNPGDAPAVAASQKRFHAAVEKYAALSKTRRSQRWAEEALARFDACAAIAEEYAKKSAQKQAALDRYTERRNIFDLVLQESRAIHQEGFQIASLKQLLSSGMAYVGLGMLALLFGAAVVFASGRQTLPPSLPQLEEVLQCVEAAAAGDVSRLPQAGSNDETGRLGRGVGRLIAVLGRSENLVYHLAALVESSGDAIISYTLDGTILSWNKGAQRIYGFSADEMKGQPIALLSPQDNGIEMDRALQRIRHGERVQPFETIHQARNGRKVVAFIRMSAILGSTHQAIGASFCAQELTDKPPVQAKFIEGSRTL